MMEILLKWKTRYGEWVEREQAKNDKLREKGGEEWEEVKQLWQERKRE